MYGTQYSSYRMLFMTPTSVDIFQQEFSKRSVLMTCGIYETVCVRNADRAELLAVVLVREDPRASEAGSPAALPQQALPNSFLHDCVLQLWPGDHVCAGHPRCATRNFHPQCLSGASSLADITTILALNTGFVCKFFGFFFCTRHAL